MKKIKDVILVIGLVSALFVVYTSLESDNKNHKISFENQSDNDFGKFLIAISPLDASFREQYEICREQTEKVLDVLSNNKPLNSEFKIDALQNIRKAQMKLEEFKNTVIRYKNSKNSNVRKMSEQSILLYKYGREILEQYYKFISAPDEYISSNENLNKFKEYSILFKAQYENLCELVQETSEIESSNRLSTKDATIEFQYSKDELKAIEKWKKKTMTELINDAMHGDAAGLYMIGMSHLYGKGGFPINVEQANQYFATSALLGFAPAMDRIKFMYIEDNENPCLALVYINLTASLGHREFTLAYHDLRKKWVDNGAHAMVKEVERIATAKQLKIYKTMNELKKAEDKMKMITSILFVENGIIGGDEELGWDYWEKFLDKGEEKC